MVDQVKNSVIVYTCIFGEEDKAGYKNRLKRNGFNEYTSGSTRDKTELPMYARELLAEVCNLNLPNITFGTYQKNNMGENDYEIQLLIDTSIINKIEQTLHNRNVKESYISPIDNRYKFGSELESTYLDPDLKPFDYALQEMKELILPFKKAIGDEVFDEKIQNGNRVYPFLRTRCILMPIKLERSWTLIWIKFTKLSEYVEIFQLSGQPFPNDKLSFKSQEFIKLLLADLFNLDDSDDLMFTFRYISENIDSESDVNLITVRNIERIIKGYQWNGFNILPMKLPKLTISETTNPGRQTRMRALPLMELNEVREYNTKQPKRKAKSTLLSSNQSNSSSHSSNFSNSSSIISANYESRRKSNGNNNNISTTSKNKDYPYSNSKLPSNKRLKSNRSDEKSKKSSSSSRSSATSTSVSTSTSTSSSHSGLLLPSSSIPNTDVIVTLENLATIKKTIDYDPKRMQELIELYVDTYNKVESFLLDKWSRVHLFTKEKSAEMELPFLIYGPSQIEFEILREGGIIATNTLKEKILKYNVTLNTTTMRYLTSSRRWINQRFKFNKKNKTVFYTRDTNLIIPDYKDVPYIVMATHLAYDCASPAATFEITHKNWYISRKMVSFIIAECYKCKGKYKT